ncbi:pyridoxal phosphate-dependent transferase [Aspergillus bertholletiae]|uniref:Ornithine aminotransferase n=1 Tax=Aspergillus bertholletiae TaxID=1226010 RepID=A0A5N7AQ66_9EURO|nr:pyridoxal phosphate-dependent transferase [Aspergillus bertholletiae]
MISKKGEPLSGATEELLAMEEAYTAGGFGPTPGFIVSASGSTMIDIDGKEILDFASTMSAVNLGHCNPVVTGAVVESIQRITQANIATHTNTWPPLAKALCHKLGYHKVAAMVSGAEAADSAVKIACKWGIVRKGILPADVLVLGCSDNYHGLTSGIWPIMNPGCGQEGMSLFSRYGISSKSITNRSPTTGGLLRYGHVEDFESVLREMHHLVAGIIMEPIHGTLRTFEEEINFAIGVRRLCTKYNILFISDEVRMGSAKTGKFLCSDWLGPENKPDIVTLGKSITGGVYPASYVLGFNETMNLVQPNQIASTYAMSPAANAATLAALGIYEDTHILERATAIQNRWNEVAARWNHPFIDYCTARGADLGIVIKMGVSNVTPRRIARLAYQKGVLIYPQNPRLRLSVALTITDDELDKGLRILTEVMDEIASYDDIPGSTHTVEHIAAGF